MNLRYTSCFAQKVTPESTVIAFDLHNVVFKKRTTRIFLSCIKLIPKGTWRYTLNPFLWLSAYRVSLQTKVAEDVFQRLAEQYPGLVPYRNDFIMLTNTQRPIDAVVDVLHSLKERGYKLFVLSNIGRETYEQLSTLFPEIHCYFDGAFTATAENKYVHKPHLDFYEQFKQYLQNQGHGDKQILFIDDLKKNIVAAAKCNIGGVHYRSSGRLRSQLKKLEILS